MSKDGGPAFPVARGIAADGSSYIDAHYSGMSLRDYFAASALHRTMSREDVPAPHLAALRAYEYADAMLAERDK